MQVGIEMRFGGGSECTLEVIQANIGGPEGALEVSGRIQQLRGSVSS